MRRIRHKKRGTDYRIIGTGFIQTDKPLHDYDRITIYQSLTPPYDEEFVVRPDDEMRDGRFEYLPERNYSGIIATAIPLAFLLVGLAMVIFA